MFSYQKIVDPFLIYVIKFSGKVDRNDIDLYKKSLKEMLVNNKFYYIIFDIIEVDQFKTKYMMELFSEIKNVKEEFRNNMKGCSIIFPAIMGLLAILFFVKYLVNLDLSNFLFFFTTIGNVNQLFFICLCIFGRYKYLFIR